MAFLDDFAGTRELMLEAEKSRTRWREQVKSALEEGERLYLTDARFHHGVHVLYRAMAVQRPEFTFEMALESLSILRLIDEETRGLEGDSR